MLDDGDTEARKLVGPWGDDVDAIYAIHPANRVLSSCVSFVVMRLETSPEP